MKKNQLMRTITTVALVATMALTLAACGSDSAADTSTDSSAEVEQAEDVTIAEPGEVITAGYGDNYVELTVVINTGESFGFELSTEQESVGEAIEVEGMAVLAEDGTVSSALGLEATDGATWNFYVDGQLSSTSVKDTPIEEGVSYALIIE